MAKIKEGSVIWDPSTEVVIGTIATINDVPTKLSDLEADVELGGNFVTIGTVKPTDGSMWYQEI